MQKLQNGFELFIRILIKNNIVGRANAVNYPQLYELCENYFDLKEYKHRTSFHSSIHVCVQKSFNVKNKGVTKVYGILDKLGPDHKPLMFLKQDYLEILKLKYFELYSRLVKNPHLDISKSFGKIDSDNIHWDKQNLDNKPIHPGEYKIASVKVRRNHTKWAKYLKDKHQICAVCGVKERSLLIASHILPWSKSKGNEKTDPNNGIVLCVLHDKLFELDYISFDNKGYLKCLNVIKEYDQFYNVSKDKIETLSNSNLKLLSVSEYDLGAINKYLHKKLLLN